MKLSLLLTLALLFEGSQALAMGSRSLTHLYPFRKISLPECGGRLMLAPKRMARFTVSGVKNCSSFTVQQSRFKAETFNLTEKEGEYSGRGTSYIQAYPSLPVLEFHANDSTNSVENVNISGENGTLHELNFCGGTVHYETWKDVNFYFENVSYCESVESRSDYSNQSLRGLKFNHFGLVTFPADEFKSSILTISSKSGAYKDVIQTHFHSECDEAVSQAALDYSGLKDIAPHLIEVEFYGNTPQKNHEYWAWIPKEPHSTETLLFSVKTQPKTCQVMSVKQVND